ncbi:MAG: TRAP transporter small permease [Zetaproteobacteria bacterium]|jgi:TRAP-type C4-dicarboxylate transport system permease small subunit|nr:MAG: TRAP transporter small permease [Zetaproteobacteria bacterium]
MGTRTRWIWAIVEQAALGAFVAMLVLVVAQVFFRYVLEISVPWTEEAARWFYAYQIFLGCTIATRDRLHLRATFILERFPSRLAAAVECLIAVATLLFVAGIVWGGVVMVWATSTVEAGSFALSMSYLYLAIPVSFVIVFVLTARDLGRAWRSLHGNPKAEEAG